MEATTRKNELEKLYKDSVELSDTLWTIKFLETRIEYQETERRKGEGMNNPRREQILRCRLAIRQEHAKKLLKLIENAI